MSASICLTYDDALTVHREIVAALLTERGLRGTFYLPAACDDLHTYMDGWRKVAEMGHELGNHSCFHPCRTRPNWDWKPPYCLEDYNRERIHDELLLANRILHLVDGRSERSFGATCGDLTVGQGESFVDDIRNLFTVVRSVGTEQHLIGTMPFVVPAWFVDFYPADEIIQAIETMHGMNNACIVLGIHGVGMGTHNSFIDAGQHLFLIDWISTQRSWLESVTVLEAAHRLQK